MDKKTENQLHVLDSNTQFRPVVKFKVYIEKSKKKSLLSMNLGFSIIFLG